MKSSRGQRFHYEIVHALLTYHNLEEDGTMDTSDAGKGLQSVHDCEDCQEN